jgi:hypothetical protein
VLSIGALHIEMMFVVTYERCLLMMNMLISASLMLGFDCMNIVMEVNCSCNLFEN